MTNYRRNASALPSYGRLPFVVGFAIVLFVGVWAALRRVGWDIPQPHTDFAQSHGGLLVSGVFGTFITLQRAIIVSQIVQRRVLRQLPYLPPVLTLVGSAAALVNFQGAALFAVAASIGYVIGSGYQYYRQRSLDPFLVIVGGFSWFTGNVAWLSGDQPKEMTAYWMVFLILTFIEEQHRRGWAGKKLPSGANLWAIAGYGGIAWGISLATSGSESGFRLMGLGEILIALWLFTFDTARQPDNRNAPPRPIAVCLLSAFFWLTVGGVMGLGYGAVKSDHSFEAFTHTFFIGFAISMLFAHAPQNMQTALNVVPQFNRAHFAQIGLLNFGIAGLVIGDFITNDLLRHWGGLLVGMSLLVFIGLLFWAAYSHRLANAKAS